MTVNQVEYEWKQPELPAHSYLFPVIFNLIKNLKIYQNACILDTGCGGGFIMAQLHKLGYKNIYGFDISQSAIETTIKNFPLLKEKVKVHDVYDSLLPSDFPRQYDLILSIEVIEHLFLPRKHLFNISKWLKNDGYLILSTPYHGYFKNLLIALLNKFDNHFNPLWDFGHIKFFSKSTLYALLEECGFKVIKFKGVGRLPYLWKSMIIVAKKNL